MTTNTASEFTFHKAVRQQIRLLLGLSGGTGSGKTYSAMKLAKGLAGDKRFCVIDTENGRASLYAPPDDQPASAWPNTFDFDAFELHAPFTPDRYLSAIEAAEKAGYPVIIVDSASHEWAGDGGILDMQEDELYRMAKDDYGKREACKMASWVKPKMSHKAMVTRLLQLKAHVILCFRAEPKVEMVKNERGKMEVQAKSSLTGLDGWIPICEKNLPFELTTSFLFMPNRPGVPLSIKLQEQHKAFFPLDKPITEEAGRLIGEWAKGGTPKIETIPAKLEPKPPIQETKPGVCEPKGQWTDEMSVNLCRQIESARSIQELQLYGEQAKVKQILEADRDTMRALWKARKKTLENGAVKQAEPDSPQSPQGEAGAEKALGRVSTAPPTAEKAEEPWI